MRICFVAYGLDTFNGYGRVALNLIRGLSKFDLFREYSTEIISETPNLYFLVRVPQGQEIAYACTIDTESIVDYVDLNTLAQPI